MLGNDYDLLIHSIPLESIERILKLNLADHDKRRLIAYHIALKLEGISLRVPKKTHKTDYARFLISLNIERDLVLEMAEIKKTSYYEIKKEIN